MLVKSSESAIESRHKLVKIKMESQFTENTKEEFHHKLENLLSKLDKMVEAIKSESEEDRSWIPQAVGVKIKLGKTSRRR